MSLDAFNYTKDALLYAFCYGVYVKQLCSPWTGERIKGSVSPKRLILFSTKQVLRFRIK